MVNAKEFVESKIKGKKVVVFSKTYCPFCVKAKECLKKYAIPADQYEEIELEDMPECQEIQDVLKDITGGRSVPRVFIAGKFIGGCDDTLAKEKSGELKELLQKSGAI